MDPGLQIAATGMLADQVRENQLTNDLANASTPGYKPDQSSQGTFGQLLLANSSNRHTVGIIDTGVQIDRTVTDLSSAPLTPSSNPLDFGIAGPGFFAVRTAQGVRYTRDGQFSTGANGTLVDQNGNPVLGQGGGTIAVGASGTVAANAVGIFNVPNPTKQGDNLFAGTAAGRGTGVVQAGMLEGSGVDPTQTMVQMIASLQGFDAGQKALQTFDQTMQRSATSVGSISG
jgi:flagellar basal-body rod protein FlgF